MLAQNMRIDSLFEDAKQERQKTTPLQFRQTSAVRCSLVLVDSRAKAHPQL
jgi:hypothetical protein